MSGPCPICPQMIGQSPQKHNGACQVIDAALRDHVEQLYQCRPATSLPPGTNYNQLPLNQSQKDFIWRIRSYDVNWVLKTLTHDKALHILDIGAWNGWLSHHLVRAGHYVTSIEYSNHHADGLGAMQHYDVKWHTIQMDLTQLDSFQAQFDVVIINHGLHYFPNPVEYVRKAMQLVNPGGRLIALNLMFYLDPSQRIAEIQHQQDAFEANHNVPYFIKPSRGYLSEDDWRQFKQMGMMLHNYPVMWRANLKARFRRTAPRYAYGILYR